MDADALLPAWDAPPAAPVPVAHLQPGERYRIVMGDC
jgi:hypothetical protein